MKLIERCGSRFLLGRTFCYNRLDAARHALDLAAITALSKVAIETDNLADFEKILTTLTTSPD